MPSAGAVQRRPQLPGDPTDHLTDPDESRELCCRDQ